MTTEKTEKTNGAKTVGAKMKRPRRGDSTATRLAKVLELVIDAGTSLRQCEQSDEKTGRADPSVLRGARLALDEAMAIGTGADMVAFWRSVALGGGE